MESGAVQIASKIKLGWNIGNTMEAVGCVPAAETCWGNPKITKELLKVVKDSGFDAVRIPISWDQYSDQATAKIDPAWLARVKEVVKDSIDNDLYVLINIHWDGGWLDNNINVDKQDFVRAKQQAFWEQIATELRDFDEHLLLASANEPPVNNETEMKVLLSYHQAFIDAVRSTGGKNTYRTLVVQGPSTDLEKTNKFFTQWPTDPTSNRLMAEVHFYGPYNFALMDKDADWGKRAFYWGKNFHSTTDAEHNATWGEEDWVDAQLSLVKKQFSDKGIPVVMGEFAAVRRTTIPTPENQQLHYDSRAYWHKYLVSQGLKNGLIPFYWDNGVHGDLGMAIFNRQTNQLTDSLVMDAMLQGAGKK